MPKEPPPIYEAFGDGGSLWEWYRPAAIVGLWVLLGVVLYMGLTNQCPTS